MENAWNNFLNSISEFLPGLLGALIVLLIGWIIARVIKSVVVALLRKTSWDEKVFGPSHEGDTNNLIGTIIYYLIMIIVLIAVLDILGMNQVLQPLKDMMNQFLLFIPNLIGALIIAFIGYVLAKFISSLITIGGSFLDKIVDKTGFKSTEQLVNILQKVVFILIIIPFLIQALNALELEAVSEPANKLLSDFVGLIGNLIIAAIILFIFIYIGKFLANFLEGLFKSIGLDRAGEKIQIQNMIGNQSLSSILANLIYFFLVFFGLITAVGILGLNNLEVILNEILAVTGQILFGLVILAIGNYISLLVYNSMSKSENNTFIAGVIRWAILALFLAMALRTMGIANEIVELAFGLLLGAIAVAVALSYGLGGREAAGEHFKDIIKKFRSGGESSSNQKSDTTKGHSSRNDNENGDYPPKDDRRPNNPNRPL